MLGLRTLRQWASSQTTPPLLCAATAESWRQCGFRGCLRGFFVPSQVRAEEMGMVNGVHSSLSAALEMGSFAAGLLLKRTEQFGLLMAVSLFSVRHSADSRRRTHPCTHPCSAALRIHMCTRFDHRRSKRAGKSPVLVLSRRTCRAGIAPQVVSAASIYWGWAAKNGGEGGIGVPQGTRTKEAELLLLSGRRGGTSAGNNDGSGREDDEDDEEDEGADDEHAGLLAGTH